MVVHPAMLQRLGLQDGSLLLQIFVAFGNSVLPKTQGATARSEALYASFQLVLTVKLFILQVVNVTLYILTKIHQILK